MAAPSPPERSPQHAQLDGVPVALFLESQDHQDDLLRELRLIDLGERFNLADTPVPSDLATLIGDILARWGDVRSTTRLQAMAALEERRTETTLLVPLGPGIVDDLRRWLRLLEAADALCASGRLLTLPASPEVRRLRQWYLEEIARQAEGASGPG